MGNTTSQCPPLDDPQMQWPYCPSLPAAITFTTFFATLTVAHFLQAIIYRKKFCWVICMASAWETAGFTLRLMGARDPRTQIYSTGSNILILLSPLWVNAFAYMIVGRMVYYWLPNRSVWKLKARTMTACFVWLDVITFLIQATGGTMIDNDDPGTANLGLDIYMGGIGLQQAFLLMFILVMIRFHIDARRIGRHHPTSWRPQIYSLYVALSLITVRIIFRLVEFSSGVNGAIPKNESYFYALEATPMVLAIGTFAVVHPGRTLTSPESEFSKLIIQKGQRRWWCCGRRARTKLDPDFEMNDWTEYGAGSPLGARDVLPGYETKRSGERRGGERKHHSRRHHSRRHSSRWQSDMQYLRDSVGTA